MISSYFVQGSSVWINANKPGAWSEVIEWISQGYKVYKVYKTISSKKFELLDIPQSRAIAALAGRSPLDGGCCD